MVQWLWEETHVLKAVGSNPSTIHIRWTFLRIFLLLKSYFLFQKSRVDEKEAGDGQNKKLPWVSVSLSQVLLGGHSQSLGNSV